MPMNEQKAAKAAYRPNIGLNKAKKSITFEP
jgi:hypothetical protein